MARKMPGTGRSAGWRLGVVLAAGTVGWTAPASAQEGTVDAGTAREMVAAQAREGGWWMASNAAYRARDDALPDFYAMRYEAGPGGWSAAGCMWGGRDGEMLGPFWQFHMAWDPSVEALLVYQVSPAGAVAVGHAWMSGENEEAVQEIHAPGQPPSRIRHVNSYPHPDTLVTRSFDPDGEGWSLRRETVWVWTPAGADERPPC